MCEIFVLLGALHLHDLNSAVGFASLPNCTTDQRLEANFGNGGLTCTISYEEYLARLQRRIVRLQSTSFRENSARVGGAIFTNNGRLINVTTADGSQQSLLDPNDTFREVDAAVTFEDNTNFNHGYGPYIATTPVRAQLQDSSQLNTGLQMNLTYNNFLSGDRLSFRIYFVDEKNQRVTVNLNLTAEIVFCEERSEGKELEISGQNSALMNEEGKINFSATRLRGKPEKRYALRIVYSSGDEMRSMPIDSSYIFVTMRPCKIGESTNLDEAADVIECVECIPGTFTHDPEVDRCVSCADVDNGACSGNAVIPDEGYWHATSWSFNMRRCIGQDACRFEGREETIRTVSVQAHEAGNELYYQNDSTQCAPVRKKF